MVLHVPPRGKLSTAEVSITRCTIKKMSRIGSRLVDSSPIDRPVVFDTRVRDEPDEEPDDEEEEDDEKDDGEDEDHDDGRSDGYSE